MGAKGGGKPSSGSDPKNTVQYQEVLHTSEGSTDTPLRSIDTPAHTALPRSISNVRTETGTPGRREERDGEKGYSLARWFGVDTTLRNISAALAREIHNQTITIHLRAVIGHRHMGIAPD